MQNVISNFMSTILSTQVSAIASAQVTKKMSALKLHKEQKVASVKGVGGLYVSWRKSGEDYCGNDSYRYDNYRYEFSTQEKVDEIAGAGNHPPRRTALFWEYDTRLGRRWNLDPVKKEQESSYACFGSNPIINVDILGDDIFRVTTDGYFDLVKRTNDDTPDILVVSNDKISKLIEQTSYSGLSLEKGIIGKIMEGQQRPSKENKNPSTRANFIGKCDEIKKLFEFVADKTDVEYSFTNYQDKVRRISVDGTRTSTDVEKQIFATDHSDEEERTGATATQSSVIQEDVSNVEHFHNHPRKDGEDGHYNDPSDADKEFSKKIKKADSKSKTYIRELGNTKEYDEKGTIRR
jgi:hypothetical protein